VRPRKTNSWSTSRIRVHSCAFVATLVFLLATRLSAHVVSMSTGDLRVDGPTAEYELRIPMYEVAHVVRPETLIDHIRFDGAHRTSTQCREEDGTYVCVAKYEFPGLVDRLDVECTFYQITVPNHVHLLRAVQGPNMDQAVFDSSFPRSEIRFRPPSRGELLMRELGAGMWRAITTPAALFLLSLVIAARSTKEGALLVAMYLAGEWLFRPIAPRIPWQFSPRFIEAAMALTVAYLAIEIITLPKAGKRWLVVLMLGLFHGLYFSGLPATYLAGASVLQAAVVGVLVLIAAKWAVPAARRIAAWALLAAGLGWFVTRLV
jgi:hypothetical protein